MVVEALLRARPAVHRELPRRDPLAGGLLHRRAPPPAARGRREGRSRGGSRGPPAVLTLLRRGRPRSSIPANEHCASVLAGASTPLRSRPASAPCDSAPGRGHPPPPAPPP